MGEKSRAKKCALCGKRTKHLRLITKAFWVEPRGGDFELKVSVCPTCFKAEPRSEGEKNSPDEQELEMLKAQADAEREADERQCAMDDAEEGLRD